MKNTGIPTPPRSRPGSLWLQGAFLALALGISLCFRNLDAMQTVAIVFISLVLEALPFLLLGTLISGILEVGVSSERLTKLLPSRGVRSILIGAGLGLLMPVCECAVVPVVRRLLKKGVPLGAAVAYLLGGPLVNPLVAFSTAVAYSFRWPVVVIRLLAGYAVAVAVGWAVQQTLSVRQAVLPDPPGTLPGPSQPKSWKSAWVHALQHASRDFLDVGRFFIIGALIAAVFQSLVMRQTLLFTPLGSPALSIGMMMILAVLLNLCSEADAFVAASFQSVALPLSAQMAFMVMGPMLDIKLLVMYTGVFRWRAIVVLAGLTASCVWLAMWILELFG